MICAVCMPDLCQVHVTFVTFMELYSTGVAPVCEMCMRQLRQCASSFAWLCLIRTRSKRRRWLNKNACVLHCDIGPASRVGLEVLLLPVSFVLAFCLFRVFLLS